MANNLRSSLGAALLAAGISPPNPQPEVEVQPTPPPPPFRADSASLFGVEPPPCVQDPSYPELCGSHDHDGEWVDGECSWRRKELDAIAEERAAAAWLLERLEFAAAEWLAIREVRPDQVVRVVGRCGASHGSYREGTRGYPERGTVHSFRPEVVIHLVDGKQEEGIWTGVARAAGMSDSVYEPGIYNVRRFPIPNESTWDGAVLFQRKEIDLSGE